MQIWYKPFFHLDLNIFLGILLLFDFAICMISGDASFDSSNTISDRYLTVKFGSSCIRFTRFYRSTTGGMILNTNDSGRVAGALQTRSARPVDSTMGMDRHHVNGWIEKEKKGIGSEFSGLGANLCL